MVRKIKKYANRRLYDTQDSCYVKSSDLLALLRKGERLSVVDVASGRDITRAVLFSLLSDGALEERDGATLSEAFLNQLLRFDDDLLAGVLARYLEKSLQVFLEHEARFKRQMQNFDLEDPFATIERLAEAQRALLQDEV